MSGALPDASSVHPLLDGLCGQPFDEAAPFFAQPLRQLGDATLLAVSRHLLPAVRRGAGALRLPQPAEVIDGARGAAAGLSVNTQRALLGEYAWGPTPGVFAAAGPKRFGFITNSFAFAHRAPFWMGRSFELAPQVHRVAHPDGAVAMNDTDVKGAGPTAPAGLKGNPRLDGLLALDEAYAELFFGELLLLGRARSSIGACVFASGQLPAKVLDDGAVTQSAVLVRFLRDARRVSQLQCYAADLRERVWRASVRKLSTAEELEEGTTPCAYLGWFCDRMAENAARFAQLGVLHAALHPQNVTLAAEVVDHGMTILLPEGARPVDVLGAAAESRPEETFGNQPGRMLVAVRFLRDQLAAFAPEVRAVELTHRFVSRFAATLAEPGPVRLPAAPASAFDCLPDTAWAFAPP